MTSSNKGKKEKVEVLRDFDAQFGAQFKGSYDTFVKNVERYTLKMLDFYKERKVTNFPTQKDPVLFFVERTRKFMQWADFYSHIGRSFSDKVSFEDLFYMEHAFGPSEFNNLRYSGTSYSIS